MEWLKKCYGQLDKKTKKYLLVICVAVFVMQIISLARAEVDRELTKEDLRFPKQGQESVVVPVDIHYDNGQQVNKFNTIIELKAPELGEEEVMQMFESVSKELPQIILGANSSLAEVHSNLNLIREIENSAVDICWYSTNYELVDSAGNVNNMDFEKDRVEDVILFALMSCGKYSRECTFTVTVVCREMSSQEAMIANINKYIDTSLADSSQEYGVLPKEYEGGTLSYYKTGNKTDYVWVILGVAAAAAVVLGDLQQKKQEILNRRIQLSFDYSEVVSKVTLLMGAGMTIQRAWERIVSDYKARGEKALKRYVYEEMTESYNQMKAGIPEAEVYEQFGKRCEIKEYQKFSTLIVQNLKKGTKDLTALLELETIEAFEKRKNMARVKGEEAGTKLLVPMIMMLVVVMIIVMVPALMTFEM
ncbi:MAG: type II secretion system F family protein [Lachnospira sp.]|nr:type II secretion system F family protein [Lachnospira sp.]